VELFLLTSIVLENLRSLLICFRVGLRYYESALIILMKNKDKVLIFVICNSNIFLHQINLLPNPPTPAITTIHVTLCQNEIAFSEPAINTFGSVYFAAFGE